MLSIYLLIFLCLIFPLDSHESTKNCLQVKCTRDIKISWQCWRPQQLQRVITLLSHFKVSLRINSTDENFSENAKLIIGFIIKKKLLITSYLVVGNQCVKQCGTWPYSYGWLLGNTMWSKLRDRPRKWTMDTISFHIQTEDLLEWQVEQW